MSETRIEHAGRGVVHAFRELLTAGYFEDPTGDGPYITVRSIDALARPIAQAIVDVDPKTSKARLASFLEIMERAEVQRRQIIRHRNRLRLVTSPRDDGRRTREPGDRVPGRRET